MCVDEYSTIHPQIKPSKSLIKGRVFFSDLNVATEAVCVMCNFGGKFLGVFSCHGIVSWYGEGYDKFCLTHGTCLINCFSPRLHVCISY